MKKKRKAKTGGRRGSGIVLPKDALARINLGQAFAEYDVIRSHPSLFVRTPALLAALDPQRSKSFYVGRRGTGKTAITYAVDHFTGMTARIYPELFSPLSDMLKDLDFTNTHQQPFRSLIAAFRRALQSELLKLWLNEGTGSSHDLPRELGAELRTIDDLGFDLCVLEFVEPLLKPLREGNEKRWLRMIRKPKNLAHQLSDLASPRGKAATLIIDRVDESMAQRGIISSRTVPKPAPWSLTSASTANATSSPIAPSRSRLLRVALTRKS